MANDATNKANLDKEFAALQEAANQIKAARKAVRESGVDSAAAREKLKQAENAAQKMEYNKAAKLAEESAVLIVNAEAEAKRLEKERRELEAREEQARKKAEEEKQRLQKLKNDAGNAVKEARKAVDETRKLGCLVDEAETTLNEAESQFKANKHDEATRLAAQATEQAVQAKASARPSFSLEFAQTSFSTGERRTIECILKNTGNVQARDISVSFEEDQDLKMKLLNRPNKLAAGGEYALRVNVIAGERKAEIPVETTISCIYLEDSRFEKKLVTEFVLNDSYSHSPPGGPPSSDPLFPRELTGYYTPVGRLGSGGFARVFKVETRKGPRCMALKVPIDHQDERINESFRKEISNWQRLNHINIVKLHEFGTVPIPFIEIELCDHNLNELDKPVSPDRAAIIMFEIARGLDRAHRIEIIHRDLKPENILFSNGSWKIGDWGLSRVKSHSRSSSHTALSPKYSAPEQHSPKKFGRPDERTDIFQLGIVAYEMVTGRLPFPGEEFVEIASAITLEEPDEMNEEVGQLRPIILQCLAKKKEERYQSVNELRWALKEFLDEHYRKHVEMSIDKKTVVALESARRMVISGEMGDIEGMEKQLENVKLAAGEASDPRIARCFGPLMASMGKIYKKCPRTPGHEIQYKELKFHIDEIRGLLDAVNLIDIITGDEEIQRILSFYDAYQDTILKWEGQGDMHVFCDRLTMGWQARFL